MVLADAEPQFYLPIKGTDAELQRSLI